MEKNFKNELKNLLIEYSINKVVGLSDKIIADYILSAISNLEKTNRKISIYNELKKD